MKGSLTKPISSPGRTDKFPPPLMRFLKSNVGSKSTRASKSRASPMFMRKKNTNATVIQEPSSPKVTCIGQVRVKKRSSAATTAANRRTRRPKNQEKQKKRPCWWKIHKSLFLNRPKSYFSVLRRWVCCICQKRVETVDSCSKVELGTTSEASGTTVEAFVVTENNNEVVVPPKNALLLTRCRSAPYRSSSLASRFWGSDTEEKVQELELRPLPEPCVSTECFVCPTVLDGKNDKLESRKSHESEEMQRFSSGNSKEEAQEKNGGSYIHPLLLTRCKSEPARTGARLNPDNSQT